VLLQPQGLEIGLGLVEMAEMNQSHPALLKPQISRDPPNPDLPDWDWETAGVNSSRKDIKFKNRTNKHVKMYYFGI